MSERSPKNIRKVIETISPDVPDSTILGRQIVVGTVDPRQEGSRIPGPGQIGEIVIPPNNGGFWQ